MNPFDDFGFEEELEDFDLEDMFDDMGAAEKVVAQAQQQLSELLKDGIKKTIADAAQARKELADLARQITKARCELLKWQREAAKAQEEFEKARDFDIPKKYIDRIVHNLTGDFAPGDKAYVVKRDRERRTCPMCNGEKKVHATIAGEVISVQCPNCDGKGVVYQELPPVIEEKTVTEVRLTLCFKKDRVSLWNTENLYLSGSEWSVSPRNVYHSPEEARAAMEAKKDG